MSDIVIHIEHLTKNYGKGRGIFDINLDIEKGKCYGFIGTNGAGKTTTIRSIMGFIKADEGIVTVNGMDAWKDSVKIKNNVCYIPGEINFPSFKTAAAFLKNQSEYLHLNDFTYMNEIINKLRLDVSAPLRRMSKGMKQKTAITAALMSNTDILILDEPTTGLDPLMRDTFLKLIENEKSKGKTIFMSSHIFEEIEDVCDYAAMINDGRIIDIVNLTDKKENGNKNFTITFESENAAKSFVDAFGASIEENTCSLVVNANELNKLFSVLKNYKVLELHETQFSLEEHFKNCYAGGNE